MKWFMGSLACLVAACNGGDGDVPIPDAGPPKIEFASGGMYPADRGTALNGTIYPGDEMPEPTWVMVRVIPPYDHHTGTTPSLEGMSTRIRIESVPSGSVIVEEVVPLETFREDFDYDIGVAQIPLPLCAMDTGDGDRIKVIAVVSDAGDAVFVEGDSGDQLITCGGVPACLAFCP